MDSRLSHACKSDYASVYTSFARTSCFRVFQTHSDDSKRLPTNQLSFEVSSHDPVGYPIWWFFRISPSSNSTIPRSISVWQVFLDATRTYFSIALRLACSLSLDLLLFALGECEFRVYIYIRISRMGTESRVHVWQAKPAFGRGLMCMIIMQCCSNAKWLTWCKLMVRLAKFPVVIQV